MARRHARLPAKLLLLASSTLVALVSAEGLTRLVGWINDVDYSLYRTELTNPDRLPAGLFTWDELTGVRLTPDARVLATTSDFSVPYVINSRGLRDREYDSAKPSGRIRILALGDSLTFGEGVPYGKRFTDVAEAAFDNVEIINAGVPGYGIDQMLIYLAAEGVHFHPDYVFLFLHGVQTRRHSTRIIRDGRVVLPRAMGNRRAGAQYVPRTEDAQRGWLSSHSDLFAYLSYRWAIARHRERFEKSDERLWRRISRDAGEQVNELTATQADWERLFQRRTELLLREVVSVGADYGFETVAVSIGEYKPLDYVGAIHPALSYHSLTEQLRAASQRRNIRFTYDQHYNAETHELLGTALAHILCHETPGLSCSGRIVTRAATGPTRPLPAVTEAEPSHSPRVEPTPVREVVATTFVRRIHRGFLAREPTAEELATWSKRIERDATERGRLVEQVLAAQETTNAWRDPLFIISMYLGVFDRRPDAKGYAAHVAAMAAGKPAKRVLRTWLASEEWRRHYHRLDDAGVATRLCRRMLRRNPDAAELEIWTDRVAAGDDATVDLIVDLLYRHPEYEERNAADLLPYQLSLGMTGALPPAHEYEYWAGRLRLGESRASVIYDYIDYH